MKTSSTEILRRGFSHREFNRKTVLSIPTGLCRSAQGCEERATLGVRMERMPTPTDNGVAANRRERMQPRWQRFLRGEAPRPDRIFDQIMNEKVLDLLQQHAKIEDFAPAPGTDVNPS